MEFQTVIGLEIHAQLDTKTKLFSSSDNNAWEKEPNTCISPIDLGMPGMLPALNQCAVEKSIKAALGLGCQVQNISKFDRKNYFYPDLPMGYQISQYYFPLGLKGSVDIFVEKAWKKISIDRVHIENDAGKLTHSGENTLIDFNRAGTPLIEIVTNPDLSSAEEATIFAKTVQRVLRYCNSSTADMEKGMMRFDGSISIRPQGETKLYPRVEIKNLNSFSSLQKALLYEEKILKSEWIKTNKPPQFEVTKGWVDDENKTKLLRNKDSAGDYRYFPEPDLPPLVFSDEEISLFKKDIPELPSTKLKRYLQNFNLQYEEALKITESREIAEFFELILAKKGNPKMAVNILLSVLMSHVDFLNTKITADIVVEGIQLYENSKISSSSLKEILYKAMDTGESAEDLMTKLKLEQVSNTEDLENWIDEVCAENPEMVEKIKSADESNYKRLSGFFVGQIMKKSQGKANPQEIQKLLSQKIK